MTLPKIDNLRITKITEDILLVHQIKSPSYFSTCDGLLILPKKGRNTKCIVLDANIEPPLSLALKDKFGSISEYVFTHGHMDHIANVYGWEQIGANIHGPTPESSIALDLKNFYEIFGFNEAMDFSLVEEFAEYNRYNSCKSVNSFKPGEKLKFEGFEIETINFPGHSLSHIGFFLPSEKILHISCIGFDIHKPGADGFGPWYGFRNCSISQYFKDIDLAERIFLERADLLTSSHAYVVKNPDTTPFSYIRDKIDKNQEIVDKAVLSLKATKEHDITTEDLLELDLFFPKKKMRGFLLTIYTLWESWIIKKHIERSKVI